MVQDAPSAIIVRGVASSGVGCGSSSVAAAGAADCSDADMHPWYVRGRTRGSAPAGQANSAAMTSIAGIAAIVVTSTVSRATTTPVW